MRRRGKPGPQRDLREFEIGQTRAPHPKSGQHQQTIRFAHQPAGDRVAERLLEVVKLLRLKQIGPAEPGRGQLLLSPPQRAVRVQQGVFPGGPGDATVGAVSRSNWPGLSPVADSTARITAGSRVTSTYGMPGTARYRLCFPDPVSRSAAQKNVRSRAT